MCIVRISMYKRQRLITIGLSDDIVHAICFVMCHLLHYEHDYEHSISPGHTSEHLNSANPNNKQSKLERNCDFSSDSNVWFYDFCGSHFDFLRVIFNAFVFLAAILKWNFKLQTIEFGLQTLNFRDQTTTLIVFVLLYTLSKKRNATPLYGYRPVQKILYVSRN